VVNGDGPCNKERLAVRQMAHDKGKWVRAALMKPTAKHVAPLS
jgi:ring-1,2-phenylacetyl-CoA epoxidase subunit PaaA